MPPSGEQPLLSLYYAATIGIVSLSSAMAVLTLNINNRENKGRKVPKILRTIFFNYVAKKVRFDIPKKEDDKNQIKSKKTNKKFKSILFSSVSSKSVKCKNSIIKIIRKNISKTIQSKCRMSYFPTSQID